MKIIATLAAVILLAPIARAQTRSPPRPYTQIYVFGDSYSDTGAGYLFSNGPTALAYLAQRLGIPFTYFGDPNSAGKGLNFAVSGARTGAGAGQRYAHGELLGLGMVNQVEEFAALVRSGAARFDPAQTMFFLAGGLNDRGRPEGYTLTNEEQLIDTLYSLGARRFMVALLPTKVPYFATAGIQFNPSLAFIPADERAKHPGIRIANSDWGVFFDQVITHPAAYGIANTTDACAAFPLSGRDFTPCASPGTHFYYYDAHPSTTVHRAVGDMLYTEVLTKAP